MSKKNLAYAVIILSVVYFYSSEAEASEYTPINCIHDAVRIDTSISNGLVTQLCSAAWSREPAKCYANVGRVDAEIPRGLSIQLCAGSKDAERTLKCYEDASQLKLNRGLAITLCGQNKHSNN